MNLTSRQWTILVIAWLGWVFDIMDTGLFNFAKGPMLTEMVGPAAYKLHGAQIEGNIQAVFLLGWAGGGLVFGILADRWGRTRTLVLTVLMYCAFTGLTALCRTPAEVAGARFLTALGIGGEWAAGAALVAESVPDAARARAASLLQSAAAFGPIFAALANLALAGRPWQWLFLVGILPAAIAFLVRTRVQEPNVAAALAAETSNQPQGVDPDTTKHSQNPLIELWTDRRWRSRVLAATVIGAVGVTGAMTATYWQPNLVAAASLGMPKADVDIRKSTVAMVSHIGTLLGVFVVPWLCVRFGRKRTIGAFFAISPLVVAAVIGAGATYERLLLLSPLINFFAIGVSAAFVLYFPEMLPARIRATGSGIAYNTGRALSIPMPILTGAVIGRLQGSVAAGVVLSGLVYLLGLAALPFAPETRGQTLGEEI